jgi:hypothetical protein
MIIKKDGGKVLQSQENVLQYYQSYRFESKNYKNCFLRHRIDRLKNGFVRVADDGSDNFNLESSFKIVPALWDGYPNISFECLNFPGQYLMGHPSNAHLSEVID